MRAARRHLGLSQAALAKQVGVTARSIIRYETGTSFPPMDLLADLATAVRLDIEQLIGRDAESQTAERRPVASHSAPGFTRNRETLKKWYWDEMSRLSREGWPDQVLEGIKRVLETSEQELAALFGTSPESISDEEILRNWREYQLPAIDRRRRELESSKPSAA